MVASVGDSLNCCVLPASMPWRHQKGFEKNGGACEVVAWVHNRWGRGRGKPTRLEQMRSAGAANDETTGRKFGLRTWVGRGRLSGRKGCTATSPMPCYVSPSPSHPCPTLPKHQSPRIQSTTLTFDCVWFPSVAWSMGFPAPAGCPIFFEGLHHNLRIHFGMDCLCLATHRGCCAGVVPSPIPPLPHPKVDGVGSGE